MDIRQGANMIINVACPEGDGDYHQDGRLKGVGRSYLHYLYYIILILPILRFALSIKRIDTEHKWLHLPLITLIAQVCFGLLTIKEHCSMLYIKSICGCLKALKSFWSSRSGLG